MAVPILTPIPQLTRVFGMYRIIKRLAYADFHCRKALTEVTKVQAIKLHGKIANDITLPALGKDVDDHLYELKKLGFPFRREGPGALATGGRKKYQVHEVEGEMLKSLHVIHSQQKDRDVYRVGFNLEEAPHAWWVLRGTTTMMPRDVVTPNVQAVRKTAPKAYRRVLKQLDKAAKLPAGGR